MPNYNDFDDNFWGDLYGPTPPKASRENPVKLQTSDDYWNKVKLTAEDVSVIVPIPTVLVNEWDDMPDVAELLEEAKRVSEIRYGYTGWYRVGDKVLFMGLKAKVIDFNVPEESELWAVPIIIKGSDFVTFAHAGDLKRR